MDLAGLQEDSPQVGDALLCDQHLIVGLNHGNSSSTNTAFSKAARTESKTAWAGAASLSTSKSSSMMR